MRKVAGQGDGQKPSEGCAVCEAHHFKPGDNGYRIRPPPNLFVQGAPLPFQASIFGKSHAEFLNI